MRIGDKVVMTPNGRKVLLDGRNKLKCDTGVVVGFSPSGSLKIIRDTGSKKSPGTYSVYFWEQTNDK